MRRGTASCGERSNEGAVWRLADGPASQLPPLACNVSGSKPIGDSSGAGAAPITMLRAMPATTASWSARALRRSARASANSARARCRLEEATDAAGPIAAADSLSVCAGTWARAAAMALRRTPIVRSTSRPLSTWLRKSQRTCRTLSGWTDDTASSAMSAAWRASESGSRTNTRVGTAVASTAAARESDFGDAVGGLEEWGRDAQATASA